MSTDSKKFYKLEGEPEGLLWLSEYSDRKPIAYCERHQLPLEIDWEWDEEKMLFCPFDNEHFQIKNSLETHEKLVLGMIYKDSLQDLKIVRIDSEGSTILAKERVNIIKEYWIETKVSNTRTGVQIMIQVGKRDESGKKVQMFVDAPRQRLSFDISDKDLHPAGVFSKVTAEFKDAVTMIEPDKKTS